MKITVSQLRKIIKEEVSNLVKEAGDDKVIRFYVDGNGVTKFENMSTGKKGRAYGSAPVGETLSIKDAERYIRKEDFYGMGSGAMVPEKGFKPEYIPKRGGKR